MTVVLKVENVTKDYLLGSFRQQVLLGVSFEVNTGEFVALAGPSGSGKTTLLNLIGCLDTSDSGTILIDGVDVGRLSRKEQSRLRRVKLGFVFQHFNLLPVLSAQENVEYPLSLLSHIKTAERRQMVDRALAAVGLTEHKYKRPPELSGGQQQRVAIARALVTRPTLILADEPTSHLDQETARTVVELMRSLCDKEGVTFLFTTHDPNVMAAASRVIWLRNGLVKVETRRDQSKSVAVQG